MHGGVLAGRVAVVTGVSRGIGRAIAIAFAEAGAHVAGIYLGDSDEAAAPEDVIDALGVESHLVEADAGDPAAHATVAAAAVERWGRLDIWVNNAARLMVKPIVDTTLDDWHGLLAVNLHGYFYGSKTAAQHMLAAGRGGRIIKSHRRRASSRWPILGHTPRPKAECTD